LLELHACRLAKIALQRTLKASLSNGRADIEAPDPSDWELRMGSKQLCITIVLSRCNVTTEWKLRTKDKSFGTAEYGGVCVEWPTKVKRAQEEFERQ
jgi:hypothetical protein